MNVKKIISLIMLLFMLLPLGAQNSEGKQCYKIAACDWMMLKRQKIGSFQLMKELGGDGIEMDMGGLGMSVNVSLAPRIMTSSEFFGSR